MPFQQLPKLLWVKKMGLLQMERLKSGDDEVREGPLLPTQSSANYGKRAFVLIAGLRVCLYRCCSISGGHTVRNMPPLAFGIPMKNTVEYGFIIGGFLLSYGGYNKQALSLPRDSR